MNQLLTRISTLVYEVEKAGGYPTTLAVSYDVDVQIKKDLARYISTDYLGNIRSVFGLEYSRDFNLPAGTVIVK